jgi:F0F1-type ATP synthase assembly protein I
MGYVDTLRRDTRRVLLTQALLTLLIAVGFGLVHGLPGSLAALYGGLITIIITAWLARRVRQAGQTVTPGAGLVVIYTGTIVRYATVVVLVGVGIGLLKLDALPLLCAFAVTQFGFLANLHTP